MSLDINTPRGQRTLIDERHAVAIFESNFPLCRYLHTPKLEAGDIDGVIVNFLKGDAKAVAETKCRYDVTLEQFRTAYLNQWLITFDKIVKGMKIAEAMRLPFYGLLYIVQDKAVLPRKIWSPENGLEFAQMIVRKTTTQATVNGGQALRDNAFLDMDGVTPLYLKVYR